MGDDIVLKFTVGGTTVYNKEMLEMIKYAVSFAKPRCQVYIIWEFSTYGENLMLDTMIPYTSSLVKELRCTPVHVMLRTESRVGDNRQWEYVLHSEVFEQYILPSDVETETILRTVRHHEMYQGLERKEQMMGFRSAYFLNQFVKQQHIDTNNVHVLVFDNHDTYPSSFDTESMFLHHDYNHHVY